MAKRREKPPEMFVGERVRLRFGTRLAGEVSEITKASSLGPIYLRVECDNGFTMVDRAYAFVKEEVSR